MAHGRVGDALRGLGDHKGALAAYQAKRGIIARLAGRDDAQWQHELGATHAGVGFVHEARGDLAAAQKEYEALLAIGRRFAAAAPDDPRLAARPRGEPRQARRGPSPPRQSEGRRWPSCAAAATSWRRWWRRRRSSRRGHRTSPGSTR